MTVAQGAGQLAHRAAPQIPSGDAARSSRPLGGCIVPLCCIAARIGITTRRGDTVASPIVILTAVESCFGFLLTSTILYLVLSRGKKAYQHLFAAFLLICVIWDLGIFLSMVRNQHVEELDIIGRIAIMPCAFIPALIFHFSNLYTGRPIKWAIAVVWGLTGATWVLILAGVVYRIEGIHTYSWGNMFRVVPTVLDPLIFVFWFGVNLSACWLLLRSARRATSPLERRHHLYVISGFLAVTLAVVKALVTMGLDISFLLPLGMLLNDIFVTVIGLAIIKHRLFDITVIIEKSALYSALAGLLIFIYSFSEHVLVTYVGETIGEGSPMLHFVSIAVGIAVLIPVKNRLERVIEGYFADRRLEF